MNVQEKITHLQLGWLLFGFIAGFESVFLTETKLMKQDVWIANLFNIVAGIALLGIITYVQRQYPNHNLTEICDKLLGKWLSKVMLSIYLLNNLESASGSFRAVSMFYTTVILPKTHSDYLIMVYAACSTYAVYIGLGTLARSNLVILPLFLIGFLITCLFIIPEIQTNPFLPQLKSSIPNRVIGSMHLFTFTFSQMITFGFLMSRVENMKRIFPSCMIAILLSGLYLIMISYLTLSSLGFNFVDTSAYPFFSTIQLVKLGEYLERIEVLLVGLWTVLTMVYMVVMQYVFTLVARHVFGISKMKPFVLAIGLLFFAHACKSFIRTADHFTYGTKIYPLSSLIPCVAFPILLAVMTLIKRKRDNAIS
ncbi:endospore germination permease [Paenibacillus sp. MWE-103]|uniref:Endospore germination permease n=1 Tax=Paenibacillus artemisiicola TaxID=1172618 RepID=A0ABS3W8H1_9BACL|nr:endospore germination permease [Paenibacillus artemisiicola]MBO7744445.1 endospore germination permease [Paenibacillus artemisiicola]